MPSPVSASMLCFLQARGAATAAEKEGELAVQINQLQTMVDSSNAATKRIQVPVLFPFLPAGASYSHPFYLESLETACNSVLLVCRAIAALNHQCGHQQHVSGSAFLGDEQCKTLFKWKTIKAPLMLFRQKPIGRRFSWSSRRASCRWRPPSRQLTQLLL